MILEPTFRIMGSGNMASHYAFRPQSDLKAIDTVQGFETHFRNRVAALSTSCKSVCLEHLHPCNTQLYGTQKERWLFSERCSQVLRISNTCESLLKPVAREEP